MACARANGKDGRREGKEGIRRLYEPVDVKGRRGKMRLEIDVVIGKRAVYATAVVGHV